MKQFPSTVRFTLALLFLIALIWLAFGLSTLFGFIHSIPSSSVRLAIGFAAVGCSLIILVLVYFLSKQNRQMYFIALVVLVIILAASIMDDLGWADFSLMAVEAAGLVLLIKDRHWYCG